MPVPSTWVGRSLLTGLAGAALLVPIEAASLAPLDTDLLWTSSGLLLGLGAVIGLILLGAEAAVQGLRRGAPRPAAVALTRAAPGLLALVPVSAHLFEGAFASSLPGADAAPIILPLLGLFGLALVIGVGARLVEEGIAAVSGARLRRRRRLLAAALVPVAVALEYANRSLFRSEYPDVHTFLLLVTSVCAGLALRLALTGAGVAPAAPSPAPSSGTRAHPRDRGLALITGALTVASLLNLALCLSTGLESPESRLAIATRGTHARMLVRLARALSDRDGDGFAAILGGADCDDDDPAINPDARELAGNEIDEDCDGYIAREDLTTALAEAEEARDEEVGLWIEGEEVRALRQRLGQAPILLISVDALRGDVLADTPSNRADYPNLFALLDASTSFDHAFSPAAGTDLSMSSLLTGRIDPFSTVDRTLAEALSERGYRSYAVIPSEVLRYVGKTLITRGLSDYHRLVNDLHERDVGSYTTSHQTTARGLQYLDQHLSGEHSQAPFLLWLHYFDVHEHDEVKSSDRHQSLNISSALTVSPIKSATIMLMKK